MSEHGIKGSGEMMFSVDLRPETGEVLLLVARVEAGPDGERPVSTFPMEPRAALELFSDGIKLAWAALLASEAKKVKA